MAPASTAFAAHSTRMATHVGLVVIERPGAILPHWVSAWCRRVGCQMIRRAILPDPSAELCPGAAPCWSPVAAEAASSTAAGMAVLISRGSRCTPDAPPVVAAVRDPTEDRGVLVNAAACVAELSGALVLAHGVAVSFGERSVGLDEAVWRGRDALDAGVRVVREERLDIAVSTRLLRAHPHELVGEGLEASLLVVGGSPLGAAHPRLGLVALSAVRRAPCPVLLVPRAHS